MKLNVPNTLEQSLNGGYPGLYAEVVTHDTYRLRTLGFVPDVVFDIGANVGVFARFARKLWPNAGIVSLEPNPLNAAVYRKWHPGGATILIEAALGRNKIYHGTTARNGSGETYLSAGLGYPAGIMDQECKVGTSLEHTPIPFWTLPQLIASYAKFRHMLMKIDCEGGENSIWEDPASMDVLRRMDYLCMEVHSYAIDGAELVRVKEVQEAALASLDNTHNCERDGVHFWATKKKRI